jgi:hypothetical protein
MTMSAQVAYDPSSGLWVSPHHPLPDEQCAATDDRGMFCTARAGHGGWHTAYGSRPEEGTLHIWATPGDGDRGSRKTHERVVRTVTDTAGGVTGEPRVFYLGGRHSQEIPLDYMRSRLDEIPDGRARELAVEIAPGVYATCLGWGDFLLPGQVVRSGATIAVWDERQP